MKEEGPYRDAAEVPSEPEPATPEPPAKRASASSGREMRPSAVKVLLAAGAVAVGAYLLDRSGPVIETEGTVIERHNTGRHLESASGSKRRVVFDLVILTQYGELRWTGEPTTERVRVKLKRGRFTRRVRVISVREP